MFVSVIPYMHHSTVIKDKILVLDTCDMSVEWVTKDDVELNGIPVHFGGISDEPMTCVPEYILVQGITYRLPFMRDEAFSIKDYDTVVLDNRTTVQFGVNGLTDMLSVNKREIFQCKGVDLSYIFRYKNLYIMRLICTSKNFRVVDWMSVAVDTKGTVVAYWSSELKAVFNKELATRIDMTHAY